MYTERKKEVTKMFNAMNARKATNEFKTNEIAKMNEYAQCQAEAIGEEIAIAASKGENHISIVIKRDLESTDLRARVLAILHNNGYYVKSDFYGKCIYVAW